MQTVADLMDLGLMKPVDIEAAARLLYGIAASDEPHIVLPKAIEAFRLMAEGFLAGRG